MLHDEERNQLYNDAIRKTVQHLVQKGDQRIKVVDIGTGTGLLSMMAANAAHELGVSLKSDAYECFMPMAKCAQRVIKRNQYHDCIQVFEQRSDQRGVIPEEEKADLLITELFDTELIGEGALGAYRHALKSLMKPNCLAVPSKARVWIQLVCSEMLFKHHQLKEMKITRRDEKLVTITPPKEVLSCSASNQLHDLQLSQLTPGVDLQLISEPQIAFEFDFTDMNRLKLDDSVALPITLTNDVNRGRISVLFWWDLFMDWEGEIVLSCAPYWAHPSGLPRDQIPWREHWLQAVYHPSANVNDVTARTGDVIHVQASHDEFSFAFDLDKKTSIFCECGVHNHMSRQRLSLVNDTKQMVKYMDAVEDVFAAHQNNNLNLLYLGDQSYLPLLIAKCFDGRYDNLYCLAKTAAARDFYTAFIAANNINKLYLFENIDDIHSDVLFDAVIGEPYFSNVDLPWDLLHFWYLVTKLPTWRLNENALIVPNRVTVNAIPVEFAHLWKIRAPVGQTQGEHLSCRPSHFFHLCSRSQASTSPTSTVSCWTQQSSATPPSSHSRCGSTRRNLSHRSRKLSSTGLLNSSETQSCPTASTQQHLSSFPWTPLLLRSVLAWRSGQSSILVTRFCLTRAQ